MKCAMTIGLVAFSIMIGCRASGESTGLHSLVGILLVTGNEPFTVLSLQTGDASVRVVRKDTSAVYRNLWKLQGQKVRLWFRAEIPSSDSSELLIQRYEIVKDR